MLPRAPPRRALRAAKALSLFAATAAAQTFNCKDGQEAVWTGAQQAYCCEASGIGCQAPRFLEEAWPVSCSKDCNGRNVCEQVCAGEQRQTHACLPQAECPLDTQCPAGQDPVDCAFSDWEDWTAPTDCAALCYRKRQVATPNRCGGKPCSGALEDSKSCEAPSSCKAKVQDCRFGTWDQWSACGAKIRCQRERTRVIDQMPMHGGELCDGALSETEVCGSDCGEAQDCQLSEWMEWSGCSSECGPGARTRLRTIVTRASHGGRLCQGELSESEGCTIRACEAGDSVDCELGTWSEWSSCDAGDQRSRSRSIATAPSGGGQACTGELEQTTGCDDAVAAVEACTPGDWSAWQLCDRTCGGGQTFRTRSLGSGSGCMGQKNVSAIETAACNTEPCYLDKEPCRVDTWSNWGECSTTCGSGQQTRERSIISEAAAGGQACELPLIVSRACEGARLPCPADDCLWADWQDWTGCTKTCGGTGQETRIRSISQEATVGGQPCAVADAAQVRECGTQPCHVVVCVDGAWGDWSSWSICSKSCRGGFRWHSRKVATEANRCGAPVEGPATEEEPCNEEFPCNEDVDCVLSDWTEWSQCDDLCRGTTTRTREVITPVAGDGRCGDSEGHLALSEVQNCRGAEDRTAECGDAEQEKCTFGRWSDWSKCSATCGGGQRVRIRALSETADTAAADRRLTAGMPVSRGLEQPLFNCSQNAAQAAEGWSVGKKEWCCKNANVGCSELAKDTFNCDHDVKDAKLWSSEKREFCCKTKSVGCGAVTASDANLCDGTLLETHHCNTFECDVDVVDCSYGDWEEWSPCTACQAGERTRSRQVATQAQNGGLPCRAANTSQTEPCPTNCPGQELYYCVWGDWQQDDTCSTSCGTGVVKRTRKMELSETKPKNSPWAVPTNGEDCSGHLTELVPCKGNPSCAEACVPQDCELGLWSDWSEATCDGLCKRSRSIVKMNNDCGKPCTGVLSATKSCPADCSSKDCKLSEWSGWTECRSETDQSFNTRQILQLPMFNGMVCSGVLNQTGSCKTGVDAPVDCTFSDWENWGSCDVSCGAGQRMRSRSVMTEAANGGSPCDGSVRLIESCDLGSCPVAAEELDQDCIYSDWGGWSACKGRSEEQAYRTRSISQYSTGKGKKCDGEVMQTKGCTAESAADKDCVFSDWSSWSGCPVSCGGGQHTRSRSIKEHAAGRGKRCEGAKLEAASCGEGKCPGEMQARSECVFSAWTEWGGCSASCGEGYQTRQRGLQNAALAGTEHCTKDLSESQPCQVQLCEHAKDCLWGSWGSWSECVPSPDVCGVGYKKRSRDITQLPSGGGALCVPGVKEQVMPVASCRGQPECCVNGRWGEWEDWSTCSAKCGAGTRKRTRPLAVKETWCGEPAAGPADEYEGCEAPGCGADHDCEFNDWTEWTPCSANCHGNRTRHRSIKVNAMGAGAACRGDLEAVERCNPSTGQPQPWSCESHPLAPHGRRDCLMAEWSDWSGCSESCEGGYRTRERHIQIHPEAGGRSCESTLKEVDRCNADVACFAGRVDCAWEEWTKWSECNNLRFQYRSRGMARQAAGGGVPCTGDVRELQPCSAPVAAEAAADVGICVTEEYTCAWGLWTEWGACSTSCGSGGIRTRERRMEVSGSPTAAAQQKFALASLEGRLRELEGQRLPDSVAAFGLGFASLTLGLLVVRGLRARRIGAAEEYNVVPQHA